MNARQKLLQTAKSLRGQRDTVIDYYNANARPLPLGYRVKYEDQACAVFASVPFLMLGWSSIMPPHCRARELYRTMKALGCAVWGNSRIPIPGDLIFFGYGDKESRIDHVGIFQREESGKLYFWDIRSVVMLHSYTVGSDKSVSDYGYILAWGIPDYASIDIVEPDPEPAPAIKAGDLVRIREGARWYSGSTIKASVMSRNWYVVQNKGGRVVLGMSEDERSNIQSPIHEEDVELVQNGPQPQPAPEPGGDSIILPTVAVELPVLRKGAQGRIVETLQLLLNRWHFSTEVDGIFGDATEQALVAFQLEWGIEGTHAQVDRLTWANLLG